MKSVLPEIAPDGNYKKVEVAKMLGIGRSTLDRMICNGSIRVNRHRYTKNVTIKGREIIRYFNAVL